MFKKFCMHKKITKFSIFSRKKICFTHELFDMYDIKVIKSLPIYDNHRIDLYSKQKKSIKSLFGTS